MGDSDKVEALYKWATENKLQTDPARVSKLYDEARKRWAFLMPSLRISEIVEETLRKMNELKVD